MNTVYNISLKKAYTIQQELTYSWATVAYVNSAFLQVALDNSNETRI